MMDSGMSLRRSTSTGPLKSSCHSALGVPRSKRVLAGDAAGRDGDDASVTAQDVRDGADGGDGVARQVGFLLAEVKVDLAWAPVEAVAYAKHALLDVAGRACRGGAWTPRAVAQHRVGISVVPAQPLVGDTPADAELPGSGRDGEVEMTNGMNECETNFVHGRHLPRHWQAPSGPTDPAELVDA